MSGELGIEARYKQLANDLPDAVKDVLTVEGRTRRLVPRRVWVEDMSQDQSDDRSKLKETKLNAGTWKTPVYADLDLVEKSTGRVISRNERVRVADIPRPTPHGSLLINGVEYHPHAQLRLRPGVYVRERQTGEVAAQFNFAKNRQARIGFDLEMDPADGLFYVRIGQTNLGLYPLLRTLGVDDHTISKAWGSALLEANKNEFGNHAEHASKISRAFSRVPSDKPEDAAVSAREYFRAAKLDPTVTESTLGERHSEADPAAMLAASRKMILVNRGQAQADDRDDLQFKKIMSWDEHVLERLAKAKIPIQGKLKYRIEAKDSPREAVLRADINRPIEQQLTGMTGLASAPEQLNPVGLMAENRRVVATGEGGLSDLNVVTESARAVHPSQAGFIDPVPTSQSKAAGVTLNLAVAAKKSGGEFTTALIEVRTGRKVEVGPSALRKMVVGFPDEYERSSSGRMSPKSPRVMAMARGKQTEVSAGDVTHVFADPRGLFSTGTLLVPFVDSAQGNRVLMASNQFEQYVPLKDPDAPLVRTRHAGTTMEETIGREFSSRAPISGQVVSVTKQEITIRPEGGRKTVKVSLYDNYPLNTGFIDSKPVVKPGDMVRTGQLLADTNHTKGGVLAPGKNLKTGYLSMKGYGFEDAIVVSDVAAKKLTSEHIHRFQVLLDDQSVLSLKKYNAAFPASMTSAQRAKLDEDGVIRKGERVTHDDVVIALMKVEEATPEDVRMGRVYRKLAQPWKDRAERWMPDFDGTVIDVAKQPGRIVVNIKTEEPLRVGDKLVGRHGNKGVVSAIFPSGEMPYTEDGPLEIVFNPLSVPGRINPSQILETAAGKAAAKLNETIVSENFEHDDVNVAIVRGALKRAGYSTDREKVTDPTTGVELGGIAVGVQHVMKLEHQADHKLSARGRGGYDVNLQPTRGGPQGSSAVAHLEMNALLAHGAKHLLTDVVTHKGEKNDEFWRAVQTGRSLPPPRVPFVWDKLVAYMRGAGVDIEQDGTQLQVLPMTDEQVKKLSSGTVSTADMLMARNLREIKGGLFDEAVTGGASGTKWSHVDLAEPVVNPAMQRAVRTVLDITDARLQAIAGGSESVTINGKEMTGGNAVSAMLKEIDLDKEIRSARARASKSKGDELDRANRKLRYLLALKEKELSPEKAYMLSKLPIIPPVYRPIYPLPNGELRPSGVNLLYADAIHVNNALRELKATPGIPPKYIQEVRRDLAKAVQAAFGFGDPLESTMRRSGGSTNLRGLSADIFGPRPKEGFFQDKVWRKQQDYSGRAVVVPDPKLGMDEIALPEDMAWTVFQPFIIKELVSLGTNAVDAAKEVENRTPRAKLVLERVMKQRPVTFTRAPSLHKFSFLAAYPKITTDKVIKTPPLIVTGLNLDHDGDVMAVHVPVTPSAVEDAKKMLPSNNLILPSTGQPIMVPTMEGILGAHMLTQVTGSSKETFPNLEKAEAAYKAGKVRPNVMLRIGGKQTTIGREIVKKALGPDFYDGNTVLDKKALLSVARKMAEQSPARYSSAFGNLVQAAYHESYASGFTLGIDDLDVPKEVRDKFMREADQSIGKKRSEDKVIAAFGGKSGVFDKAIMADLGERRPENAFFRMAASGAKGGPSQVRQILYTPLMVEGADGRPVPTPIRRSYSEGLKLSDYWATSYGARKGVMDRSLQVQVPGVFAKRAIAVSMGIVITEADCGTMQGVSESVDDPDILGRCVARQVANVARNTVITPQVVQQLRAAKQPRVSVRSVLRCEAPSGVCQRCYGMVQGGKFPEIGANVGVENAQYATEPTTQAQMRTFHSGGAVGSFTPLSEGFPAISSLLTMPKKIQDQATLSKVEGKVDSVNVAPAGGWNVRVGNKRHYVPANLSLKIKPGERVAKGQPMSTGLIHPREHSLLTSVPVAQEQLVRDLGTQYAKMGRPLNKRVIETVVRGLTNNVVVQDPGDHESWEPGDRVALPHILKHNANSKKPVTYAPDFRGMQSASMVQSDWIARLGGTNLKVTLEDAVARGLKSDLRGSHPLPSLVVGTGLINPKEKIVAVK